RIARARRFVDVARVHFLEVAVDELEHLRFGARLELGLHARLQILAARVGFDASALAASTRPRLRAPDHFGVTDFAGQIAGAVLEPAVDDDARADAGADVHAQHEVRSLAGAITRFAPGDRLQIVVEIDVGAQTRTAERTEIHLAPAEIGR